MWANLIGRIGGPLTFRLIVQPTVAAFFAIRAGVKDFREGRSPYGWVILSDPIKRGHHFRQRDGAFTGFSLRSSSTSLIRLWSSTGSILRRR